MKSQLFKSIILLVLLISSSYSSAAVTRYENTDTSSLIFGSYDYDDVLNKFSNVTLKANFSLLDGPADYDLDIIIGPIGLSAYADFTTEGPTSASIYFFKSSFLILTNPPYLSPIITTDFSRIEQFLASNLQGPYTAIGDSENPPTFSFTQRILNVSSVPEPEILSLILLSPLAFMLRSSRRKKAY